jgi:hypothetical protein
MTVKELKAALKGVPDHVEVTALKDGYVCERTDVWSAGYYEDEDEDGNSIDRFTINC